jgi:hypothetical protein
MEFLDEKEEDIMAMEADLTLKEKGWKTKEVEAYNDFLRKNLAKEEVVEQKEKEVKYPQVYQMINDIRSKIETGDVEGARRVLANLESTYGGMVNLEDQRLINYDINELKTNLKLASLT